MQRKIYYSLLEWKKSKNRQPLILKGARQVGKTFILNVFGQQEYQNFVYCNLEDEISIADIFNYDLDPQRIIKEIEKNKHEKIYPNNTLLILDEVQACPRALTSLKYFNEKANQYHVIATGSLLGVSVNRQKHSYPVGKVKELTLYPMDFEEFLLSIGKHEMIDEIRKCFFANKPMNTKWHEELLEIYKTYLFIGGMPEVVSIYLETNNMTLVRDKQKTIINNYLDDMSKYNTATEIVKTRLVYEKITKSLSQSNKKFKYSLIKHGGRSKEYENALIWLILSGTIQKLSRLEYVKLPLHTYASEIDFKIYLNDTGLANAIEQVKISDWENYELLKEYKGGITENYVFNQFNISGLETYYWTSNNTAEVDFITRIGDDIVPIEVKSNINNQSKSLKIYCQLNKPKYAIKISAKNFGFENNIKSVPLYAVFCINSDFSTDPIYSKQHIKVLKQIIKDNDDMDKHPEKYKTYKSAKQLFKDLKK